MVLRTEGGAPDQGPRGLHGAAHFLGGEWGTEWDGRNGSEARRDGGNWDLGGRCYGRVYFRFISMMMNSHERFPKHHINIEPTAKTSAIRKAWTMEMMTAKR